MRNTYGTRELSVVLKLFSVLMLLISCSAGMSQATSKQISGSGMPDNFQIIYNASVKILESEAEQRKIYESNLAHVKELRKKNKNIQYLFPDQYPGPVPEMKFEIRIAQSPKKFFWNSDDKSNPASFIYDGKRSYYYSRISHRMFVHSGFRLDDTMLLPLPGHRIANIPLVEHASVSSLGQVNGEIYSENFDEDGKPLYLPGNLELTSSSPITISRAVSYNNAKKFSEYVYSNFIVSDGLTIPKKIISNLYNQRTKEKKDILYKETKYELKTYSPSSLPEEAFDPVNLLKRDKEGGKTSPEFIQWYFDDGRELSFTYQPGKSLEEQAGIADYQQKKALNRVENGKIDPRNYVGLGLLVILLATIGIKVVTLLKARRNV